MGFEKSDNIGFFSNPIILIRNSVGIPYYIKRYCVPESAVRGEEYCIMALLMRFLLMKMYDFDTMNKRRKMNL